MNRLNTKNTCNGKDHNDWNRRSFLQALGFAGIGAMTLGNNQLTYANTSKLNEAIQSSNSDNILVTIQLFGGNDGLNTIAPLNQYDLYRNYRPTLGFKENELWKLSDEYAMPTFTQSLEKLWKEDQMKVIHSVGYENLIQSHFKGSDIWEGAYIDNSHETGWLGRYFEYKHPEYNSTPPEAPAAIQIGGQSNVSFNSNETRYNFSVSNVNKLKSIIEEGVSYRLEGLPEDDYGDTLRFLRGMYNSTSNHAEVIHDAYHQSKDYTTGIGYDTLNNFGEDLSIISRLIKGNLGTRVYSITVSGFDTHVGQADKHQSLLTQLSEAISYFYEDLNQAGWGDKVLTMVSSEFGRRIAENGGAGTDHGVAGPIMLFGSGLDGNGFIGEHGSLAPDKLYNNRDLQWHTDFKQVYSNILKYWMLVDKDVVDSVVFGEPYEKLQLFEKQSKLSPTENTLDKYQVFTHEVIQNSEGASISIGNPHTQHTVIRLFDLNGKQVRTLSNSILKEGKHYFPVNKKGLQTGYYIYKISSNTNEATGKIIL